MNSSEPLDVATSAVPALEPHVIVLFGATGDLARRKLLPGLMHLTRAGLMPEMRVIGTSFEDLDDDGFRRFARASWDEFGREPVPEEEWDRFAGAPRLHQRPARGARAVAARPRRGGGDGRARRASSTT